MWSREEEPENPVGPDSRVCATTGVQELWLLEPSGSIERSSGQGLNEAELVTARLTSSLLRGFELDIDELFRRG